MPEIQERARRWSGFVCPDCRFVFRVPRDHDGQGLVCPSCRRLLRLPGQGDEVPPLLGAAAKPVRQDFVESSDAGAEQEMSRVRRKRKRKRRSGETPDWEGAEGRETNGESRHGRWTLAAGLLLFVSILAVVVYAMRSEGDDGSEVVEIDADPVLFESAQLDADAGPIPPPAPMRRGQTQFLTDAKAVARAFLEATTVEELLKVVDHPEVVAERIGRYHPDGSIAAPGLGEYSQFSQVEYDGLYGTVTLWTRDHQVRVMTFREYPDELKVDWESWVGWSDMTWDEFIDQRPTTPQVFRVMLRAVEYYNFDFTDDGKWQSYRLTSPDGIHAIYGYAERNTPAHARLQSCLDEETTHIMVEIGFPENAQVGGQVVITRVLAESWIDPERQNEP